MYKNNEIFKIRQSATLNVTEKLVTVDEALQEVVSQGKAEGLRKVTLDDYKRFYSKYVSFNDFKYINEFNSKSIYDWLNSMDVANSTKRIRLKALRAVLARMFSAKLLKDDFYKGISIKVNEEIKEGATEADILLLLSHLDLSDYFQLRDAVGILMIWQTGIRLATLSQLTQEHIDFENGLLICSGDIMKNGKRLVLPLGDELLNLLTILISQNNLIAEQRGFATNLIFMSANGRSFSLARSVNTLGKKLREYSIKYDIPNINAHAIRRGFAKRLLDEGVSVPVISKALGHQSLSTTTQYLNISEAEVIHELKRLI